MGFRVLIIGGTGQVGAAVVRALAAEPSCAEVVMVNRKAIALTADPRVRQVIMDTAAAQFPADVTKLAQCMEAQGDPVYGASCVGVGKGSMKWSEEELKALEIGVVGGFARGCHVHAVGELRSERTPRRAAKAKIHRQLIHRHQIEPKTYAEAEQAFGHSRWNGSEQFRRLRGRAARAGAGAGTWVGRLRWRGCGRGVRYLEYRDEPQSPGTARATPGRRVRTCVPSGHSPFSLELELVGELVQYTNSCRLCYVRGPEAILVARRERR